VCSLGRRRQPVASAALPPDARDRLAAGREVLLGVQADAAVEAPARQREPVAKARALERAVPLVDRALAVGDVAVAHELVHR
jgi:hypothetical protein